MGVAQTTYSQEGEIDCIFSPIANGDSRHGETFYPSSLNCGPIGSLRISDAKRSITPGWEFDTFMVPPELLPKSPDGGNKSARITAK